MNTTFVKTTESGLRVEVIDGNVYLNGMKEAEELIPVGEHPNRQAILRAVPYASHMAGRLPLTLHEAGIAQSAITKYRQTYDPSPQGVEERLRKAVFDKAWREGVE